MAIFFDPETDQRFFEPRPTATAPAGLGEVFAKNARAVAATGTTLGYDVRRANEYGKLIERIEQETGERLDNPVSRFDNTAGLPTGESREQQIARFKSRVAEIRDRVDAETRARIPLVEQVDARIAENAQELEAEAASAVRRGNSLAPLAAFAGGLAGGLTDPVNLLSLPFGGAQRSLAQAVIRSAAENAAIETALQPDLSEDRAAQGLENRPARDIAIAGVIGGGFGGVGFGISRGLQARAQKAKKDVNQDEDVRQDEDGNYAIRAKVRQNGVETDTEISVPADGEVTEARNILEQEMVTAQANPFQVREAGPSPSGLAEQDHQRRVNNAQAALEQNRLPDNEGDLIAPLRPRPRTSEELGEVDPNTLQLDPRRFQFKSNVNQQGVTASLANQQVFDKALSGRVLVFEQADGQQFVVDGHSRVTLAQQAKQAGQEGVEIPVMVMREKDGYTDSTARLVGAVKNIREGSGEAADAAKVFRELGGDVDFRDIGIEPGVLSRRAQALSRLSDDAFFKVLNKAIPENFAELIGRINEDRGTDSALVDVLARSEPANVPQAERIVRDAIQVGFETTQESTLFGEEAFTRSLLRERAQVADAVQKDLKADRAAFKRLKEHGDRIQQIEGNTLNQAANAQRELTDAQALDVFARLSQRRGPVSDALGDAARRVSEGARPRDAARAVTDAVRDALENGDLDGLAGGGPGRAGETTAQGVSGANAAETTDLSLFDDPTGKPPDETVNPYLERDVLGEPQERQAAEGEEEGVVSGIDHSEMATLEDRVGGLDDETEIMLDDGTVTTKKELMKSVRQDDAMVQIIKDCAK